MTRRVALIGLVAALACDGGGPPAVTVKSVAATTASASITVGGTTQVTATVIGSNDQVVAGAKVNWTTVTPAILSVSEAGLVTGLAAGSGTVRASLSGKSADVAITVQSPPAATAAFDRDSATLTLPGGTLTLVPVVKDAAGKAIPNPTLFYSVDAPRVASVSLLGVVTAVAAGTATVTGTIEGITARIRIRVTAPTSGTAPKITSVSALAAGGSAVIGGSNFAPTIGGNAVFIEGVPATVTAATTTQLNITLPAGGWGCDAPRTVAVQVNANSEIGVTSAPLRVAAPRALAVGQSVVITAPSEVRCNELTASGTYLVSVYNTARTMAGNAQSFILRGQPTTAITAAATVAASSASRPVLSRRVVAAPSLPRLGTPAFEYWQALGTAARAAQRADATHADVMERSAQFARAVGSPAAAWRRLRASVEGAAPGPGAVARQVTQLGSITPLKIPNLDAGNFCTSNIAVGARTAWVGQHAVIVEDTTSVINGTATLKGQLDSLYAEVGNEFDTVMWPILTANFGNPLAMDQQLSRTGKIVMFFSPRINTMAGGAVSGFVVSCDFYPVSQAPSSNVGEYFYAIMPTSTASGIASGTRDAWKRSIRSTIIHEAKHITAFGERFSRNTDFEEIWLEEGTARHAEEQFARGIYNAPWKSNITYQNSIYCDVRPANASAPQCAGRPVLILRHFDGLYQYLRQTEPYSMIGRTAATDATFYATSWSMVRWMLDHYATSESQMLTQIIQSAVTGIANLEARTGRPWEEMLGEWSLMLYADDYPGLTTANARLRFPTWNMRDEFLGMCTDFGPCVNPNNTQNFYAVPFPLTPKTLSIGTFADTTNFLNAGSFSARLLSGTGAGELLDLKAVGGGDPASTLRIAILRVQ